jgi:predicted nuclease with TOPRIM domain
MRAVEPSTVLQSTPTAELELLVSAYARASVSAGLNAFERSAVLKAIEVELAERRATCISAFQFASEFDRLQAVIEDKEEKIFQLECEISLLKEPLEQEKKANGQAKGHS